MAQQNFETDIQQALRVLKSGGVILYPTDTIWGIGLAASDERARDPMQWRGLSLLGFALVEARRQLRA